MRRRTQGLVMTLLVGSAVALTMQALAHKSGGTDLDGLEGCGLGNCHAVTPDARVIASLEGLPARYKPGQTYNLTVGAGPAELARRVEPGGYAIDVLPEETGRNPGFFTTFPGDKASRLAPSSNTMTHTGDGVRQLTWSFLWRAPDQPTTVRFWVTSMLNQGQLLGQDSDWWNTESWRLQPEPADSPGPAFAAVLALLGAAAAWRRNRA